MDPQRMPQSSLLQPFHDFHISRNSTIPSSRGCGLEHQSSHLSSRHLKAAAPRQASGRNLSRSLFDYELPRRRTMEDNNKSVTSSRPRHHYYAQGLPHVPDPPMIEPRNSSSSRTSSPTKLPSAVPSRRSSLSRKSPSPTSTSSRNSTRSTQLARRDSRLCSLCGDAATPETIHLWFPCHASCEKSICISCVEHAYEEFIMNPSDSTPQCSSGEPLAFTLEDFSALGPDEAIHDILAAYKGLKYKSSADPERCCTSSSCVTERGPTQLRVASSGRKWRVCLGCRSRYCAFCLRNLTDAEAHRESPGRECKVEDVVRRVRYEARTEKVDRQLEFAAGYIGRTRGESSESRA